MSNKNRIFLASPHMSEEGFEKQYVQEAFDTNWIAPLGKNVNEFEKEMAEKLGAKDAVALSAGTAAIHLALKLVGVESGDIVFCSSLTFAATTNPIKYQGAIPVFIDSNYESWNMDPVALERAFEKYTAMGKKPKAVIFAHLYGVSADLDEIVRICKKYDCPIIEDAAESLGTKYRGECTDGQWKYTGTFGDYGIISFNGNKIITSSGGGMLLCNTEDAKEKAKKARFWATQSREPARWYQHEEIGYNYRMSNIVAGIGRGQLHVLDTRVEQKRAIYNYYVEHLSDLEGIEFMPAARSYEYSNCWLTVIDIADGVKNSDGKEITWMDITVALETDNIESRPVWKPMHLQPYYSECDFVAADEEHEARKITNKEMGSDNSVGGDIFRRGICLPSDTKMNEADMERICKVIREVWA